MTAADRIALIETWEIARRAAASAERAMVAGRYYRPLREACEEARERRNVAAAAVDAAVEGAA